MTEHTAGPWEVMTFADGSVDIVGQKDGYVGGIMVASLNIGEDRPANARLIAAAPELWQFAVDALGWLKLNDVEHLFQKMGNQAVLHRLQREGQEAIAKAKGR